MRRYSRHPEPEMPAFTAFGGGLPYIGAGTLAARLMRLIDRANQRVDLSGLTDEQLADIGVTRLEAQREAGKWFWE